MATNWRRLGRVTHRFLQISVSRNSLSVLQPCRQLHRSHLRAGDEIAPGDILCDIQTDKAVVSFEMDEEGILAKILKPEDSKDVKIGTLIAVMVDEGDDWKNAEIPADAEAPSTGGSDSPASPETSTTAASMDMAPTHGGHHSYGPAVRSLLDMYQLSPKDILATGPHGRLLKGDILTHIHANHLKPLPPPKVELPKSVPVKAPSAPSPDSGKAAVRPAPAMPVDLEGYEDIPTTTMRKTIAKRLTESKQSTPHAYARAECNIGSLLKLRKDLASDGIKVSVNDFIVKAAAVALQRVPQVNARWDGESVQLLQDIDVSVAVATETGLITPIVKDAVGLGIQEISSQVKEMAGRAKLGKLQLHEFQGGSFTISNLGMFGITEFTAIINPPQSSIMAVGGSRLVPDSEGNAQTVMTVTLCSDARVVDEFVAAAFLEAFKESMEKPMLMLNQAPVIDLQKLFAE